MPKPLLRLLFVCGLLLLTHRIVVAQQVADPANKPYAVERSLVESALQTVVTVLQEATFHNTGHSISERLREMTLQLNTARQSFQPAASATSPAPAAGAVTAEDLRELQVLLRDLYDQIMVLRQEMEDEQNTTFANRLAPVERGLFEAVETVDALTDVGARPRADVADDASPWLKPGTYSAEGRRPLDERRTRDRRDRNRSDWEEGLDDAREGIREGLDGAREGIREGIRGAREGVREGVGWMDEDREEKDLDERDDERRDNRRRYRSFDRPSYVATHVGDYDFDWPYEETAIYRPIPAIRYNRVEGLVLGLGVPPLRWDDYDNNRLYGQAGYAFALDRWRYEIGVETRPWQSYRSDYGFKLGGNYHYNTGTNDLWKSSWLENSLSAFLFRNDFFDYHQVEGWTVYAVQQLSQYAQLSAGYRSDDYSSLSKRTTWALFGGDAFRANAAIDDGLMHSFVFALEGGRVAGMDYLPRGLAFRTEVELGEGLGGDFSFSRSLGDVRAYVPVSRQSVLGLRLRAGSADGSFVPLQKHFTLGGAGTVRGYPQNVFYGTRLLVANAEYAINDFTLLNNVIEDVQFFAFADAGWVNDVADRFDADDALAAAGFGVGLDDRHVRLELAWPLRDAGFGRRPTLWLRLNPTF